MTVPHGDAGKLENDLRARGLEVRSAEYAEAATLLLAVDPGLPIGPMLAELTGGSATSSVHGEEWADD